MRMAKDIRKRNEGDPVADDSKTKYLLTLNKLDIRIWTPTSSWIELNWVESVGLLVSGLDPLGYRRADPVCSFSNVRTILRAL